LQRYYKKALKNATEQGITNFSQKQKLIINKLAFLITTFLRAMEAKKDGKARRSPDFFP